MSRKQPVGQVRLTNIAIVKYKTKGLRFEIACFPNKVLDWRKRVEKDLSNVIQSPNVFSNVSKGSFARRDDLVAAFGTLDQLEVIKLILDKGELQVSEKERQQETQARTNEIISIVTGMCVNSETKQPISSRVIEQALKESSFQINLTQSAKQQAMKVFRLLSQTLPIERVKMKVLISSPAQHTKSIKTLLATYEDKNIMVLNVAQTAHSIEFTLIIDPGHLREITTDIQQRTNGQGDVSVVDLQVEHDDLVNAEQISLDATNGGGDDDDDDGMMTTVEMPSEMQTQFLTTAATIDSLNKLNDEVDVTPTTTAQPVMTRPPVAKPTPHTAKYTNDYDDDSDDDDISFILSKSVTVLREDDEATNPSSGPSIVTHSTLFNKNQPERSEEENSAAAVQRQALFAQQKFSSKYLDDDNQMDSSLYDEDAYDTPAQKRTAAKTAQPAQSINKSGMTQFLLTNTDRIRQDAAQKAAIIAQKDINTATAKDAKSVGYLSKYEPQITQYKEFLQYFDIEDEYDDAPLLKQDLQTLQTIQRQIMHQQQAANEEYDWIFELPEEQLAQ